MLEDLAALVRLPMLLPRIQRVLDRARGMFQLPSDSPFLLLDKNPGDGRLEFGYRWMDRDQLVGVFMGMAWGDQGHDPAWEVRMESPQLALVQAMRAADLHRIAARRADSRFSGWDRFWHEDHAQNGLLIGATAPVTRFFEEANPEHTAAEYLSGAFYALHGSGALQALLEVARQFAEPETPPPHS